MSKTLDALSTKLTWQLNELTQSMSVIEQQLAVLEQEYQTSQQRIINASEIPTTILPEQEMARLQFILHEQEQQDTFNTRKTALNLELTTLQAKQLRLKTELKRLEQYQENQRHHSQQQTLLAQYKQADEWSLLHRERA